MCRLDNADDFHGVLRTDGQLLACGEGGVYVLVQLFGAHVKGGAAEGALLLVPVQLFRAVDGVALFVLEELLDALQELDPDGRRIGELLLEGKNKVEISSILGIARTTYNYRFDKLRKALAERLKK